MALQSTLSLDNGLTVASCYHRIQVLDVTIRHNGPTTASAMVVTFRDLARAVTNKPIVTRTFEITFIDNRVSIPLAYELLKALPEFAGAIEV